MKRRIAALAAMLVLAAGCSARTPEGIATPQPTDPTTTGSATPKPKKTKKPIPSARLAVYVLDGGVWLYDVAKDTVQRLSDADDIRSPRWVDKNSFSFVQDNGGESALMLFNIRSGDLRTLFTVETGIAAYGWSPNREIVAYVTVDGRSYPQLHYRSLVGSGATQTVATLARALGREGVLDDQSKIEFSKDGQRVLVVFTPADGDGDEITPEQTQLQIRTVDGTLAFAPSQASDPTMGLWAPNGSRVFFRTTAGARSWTVDNGRVTPLAGRPVWFNPTMSADGKRIAFDTGGQGNGRVRILDLSKGRIDTVSKTGRVRPVFAGANVLWVQRVKACAHDCLSGYEATRDVFAIDLKTGEEKKIAIRSLADVDVLYG